MFDAELEQMLQKVHKVLILAKYLAVKIIMALRSILVCGDEYPGPGPRQI